jgi:hypothetical protein
MDRIVGEFNPEFCGDYGQYVLGVDPYKIDKDASDTIGNAGLGIAFNTTEELYLGSNCTIFVEIRYGTEQVLINEKKAIKYWVEVGIKNRELLENVIPEVSRAVGVEHTTFVEGKSDLEIANLKLTFRNDIKEKFRKRILRYRDQLIDFIKQNS